MKFLIYGKDGWLGMQFCGVVKAAGGDALSGSRVTVIEDVLADLEQWKPDRVICVVGRTFGPGNNTIGYLEQPGRLPINVRDNLTAPILIAVATSGLHGKTIPMLYIGSGCIFEYDATHTVGGQGFNEDDNANFFGSAYSVIKGHTDLLMIGFPHVINARFRMPISDELNSCDFITKIVGYKKILSIKNSMTVLSDWIPLLLALLAESKTGTINAVNPGVVDHKTILRLYDGLSDTKLDYQLTPASEESNTVVAKRSLNAPTADKVAVMLLDGSSVTKTKYGVPDVQKLIDESNAEALALRFNNSGVDKVSPVRNSLPENHKRTCSGKQKMILVTGGAGFIGSNFINYWIKNHSNDTVVNYDSLDTNSNLRNIEDDKNANYKFIHASLLDQEVLKKTFEQYRFTHVVHFAAASTVDPSFNQPLVYIQNNIIGTFNLLEAVKSFCKDLQLFIHISTDEVYGEISAGTCREDSTPFFPTNPYAATKAGAECLVMSYIRSFHLPCIITRANNIYGKNQFPTQVIPKFITSLLSQQKLPVHGTGENSRRFLYVEDYCRALQTVMERGVVGEVYNIGTEDEIRIIDLCKLLVSKVQGKDRFVSDVVQFVGDRPHNDCRYSVDSTKIRALGWAPKMTFDMGIDLTIDWYRNARIHWNIRHLHKQSQTYCDTYIVPFSVKSIDVL